MTRDPSPDEPFAQQLEWLNHRYDPGYYLGGNLRPELRFSMGPRAKRVAALLALGPLVGWLSISFWAAVATGQFVPEPFSFIAALFHLQVGRRLWGSAGAEAPLDRIGEGRRLLRASGMTVLATAVAVLIGFGLLIVVGAVTALSLGHGEIAALLCLIASAAAVRYAARPRGPS